MPRWRENNYTKTNGERVVNERDFHELDREMNRYPDMNVEFKYVPGHAGNHGNECADRLAKEGAKRYSNNRYWNFVRRMWTKWPLVHVNVVRESRE